MLTGTTYSHQLGLCLRLQDCRADIHINKGFTACTDLLAGHLSVTAIITIQARLTHLHDSNE